MDNQKLGSAVGYHLDRDMSLESIAHQLPQPPEQNPISEERALACLIRRQGRLLALSCLAKQIHVLEIITKRFRIIIHSRSNEGDTPKP